MYSTSQARWLCAVPYLALTGACSEPEPAEVVVQPPTVGFSLHATDDGFEAVYDLGNPNGFPITAEALFVGVDVGDGSDARCLPLTPGGCDAAGPDWPAGAMLVDAESPTAVPELPARQTISCHPAIEGCVVDGDQWCCDEGARCQPLGDCFGRVTPDGSRCLVCPSHVAVRVPLTLAEMPDAARGAARFTGDPLGRSLIVAP